MLQLVEPQTESDTVIGPGLALTQTPEGRIRLYTMTDDHADCVGTFDDAASAWAALDALDEAA